MKKFIAAVLLTAALLSASLVAAFLFFVNTAPLTRREYLTAYARIKLLYPAGAASLTDDEIRTLYRWTCTGRCHGAEPVETSRHTAREWEKIIERMRTRNGAKVSGPEEHLIVSYLQKNFGSNVPTILSPEANRFLKKYLWRTDFGESDLYVDIIYAPVQYFGLLGGMLELKRFEAGDKIVFMVYLNTHQGKLERYPIGDLAVLRGADGNELRPIDWNVTYESGDKHHMEGVLRFEMKSGWKGPMELVLRDLPGQKERIFLWELPVPDFEGTVSESL